MKDLQGIQRKQPTLSNRDCLHEVEVEPRGNVGVQSIPSMSENGRDDVGAYSNKLLEKIVDKNNLNLAYIRVKNNKGSHGIDEMTTEKLLPYLKENGQRIKQEILDGKYRPNPVKRVEIPKPDGGIRLLGIPTVLDRMIQQAMAQIITPIFDKGFSENSYGFRINKNAHQAIRKSKQYIEEKYNWIVDIDLEKYFDMVNHDKLMALVARKIEDKRVLKLIRLYLKSGVMLNGVVVDTKSGCPQGGHLSPLLSNIMLNELDKELEQRGHRFCRYADDCNIYVKSRKAAERVMDGITEYLEKKLKLKVNKNKSAIRKPWELKFLGFSFYLHSRGSGIRVHPKSVIRLKQKLKNITRRSSGRSMEFRYKKLRELITGWVAYFGIASMKSLAQKLDQWVRRRLRMCYWKQWKKIKTKHDNLVRLGLDTCKAWEFANTRKKYWRISNSWILATTLTNEVLRKLGFLSFTVRYAQIH